MHIRPYRSSDCPALAELFYQTVHTVCARDYSPEQLDAWADGRVELAAWDWQGRGVASALCDALPAARITHASITARPFFERRGWHVVKEQQVERRGVLLTNFVMERSCPPPSRPV